MSLVDHVTAVQETARCRPAGRPCGMWVADLPKMLVRRSQRSAACNLCAVTCANLLLAVPRGARAYHRSGLTAGYYTILRESGQTGPHSYGN